MTDGGPGGRRQGHWEVWQVHRSAVKDQGWETWFDGGETASSITNCVQLGDGRLLRTCLHIICKGSFND